MRCLLCRFLSLFRFLLDQVGYHVDELTGYEMLTYLLNVIINLHLVVADVHFELWRLRRGLDLHFRSCFW